MRCQAAGCEHHAVSQDSEHGWWLCRPHMRLYATHNSIVRRILQIPPREG